MLQEKGRKEYKWGRRQRTDGTDCVIAQFLNPLIQAFLPGVFALIMLPRGNGESYQHPDQERL
ncbi:MAG: hypothetical protein BA864_07370 [Desulfuromonadales bacterium C00003093]|nr:MAG: hypothetical protein BA864_07370 [Desulfuromonadales bacterium C00003093]